MHTVKIEFCPLYWYSSSPTAMVLYNRMYMCKVFSSNHQKLKKRKCDLHEINSASPKAVVPNVWVATESWVALKFFWVACFSFSFAKMFKKLNSISTVVY